jgi:hypothetical protein
MSRATGAPTTDALEVFFTLNNLASSNTSGVTLDDFEGYVANNKTSIFQTGADMATITWNNTQNAYQVTIPAGQVASKPIVMKAENQSTLTSEAMSEHGYAYINVGQNRRNYVVVPSSIASKKDTEQKIFMWSYLYILKDITSFGTAGNSPVEHFENAISMTDVKQGGHGDCYFMATLLVLADHQQGRKHIVEHITQKQLSSGTKEFEVEFEDKDDQQQTNSKYAFSLDSPEFLDRGRQMAEFSGDWHKDNDVKPDTNIHRNNDPDIDDGGEIWTQLYEFAWAKHKGGWQNTIGEHINIVWEILTKEKAIMIATNGKSNQQIYNKIKDEIGNGKLVCVATKQPDNFTLVGNYNGNIPKGAHAYYVKNIIETSVPNRKSLNLINPWGYYPGNSRDTTVTLLYDDMKVIYVIYILDAIK